MNKNNLKYMREEKRNCFINEWNNYYDRSGTLHINKLSNVKIKAMGQVPGIELSDLRLIDDCDYYSEIIETNDETPLYIKGKVLYAGYLRKSWGHFLMNSTARLWPAFMNDIEYDHIVFIAEDNTTLELSGNFKEFCELCGSIDKCLILPQSTYHFECLIVGDISLEIGRYYSQEFLAPFNYIREQVLKHTELKNYKKKGTILTRSNWNKGRTNLQFNVGYFEHVFCDNGYDPISPEGLSLKDLILHLNSSNEIVSFSGTTAHNILFCPNKKLTILERCAANNVYQIGIMKILNNENTIIDCFYQPMIISSTDNLTIYGITAQFEKYTRDNGFSLPKFNDNPLSEFRKYLKICRSHYGYSVGLNKWECSQYPAIIEAYFDSYSRYEKYLNRQVPVLWTDFFSPRVLYRMLKNLF